MFIDSMQFLNSRLDKIVINLSHEGFKNLVEEFGAENLELLKKRWLLSKSTSLKDLMRKNCLLENIFLVHQKKEKLVMMVKNQTVT